MMKKITFLFIFLLMNLNISFAYSKNKIVFIDLNFILSESISGKKILNELNELSKKNEKNFKEDEKKLNAKKNEIKNLKNIISENEYKKKIEEFQINVSSYKEKKSKIIKTFENGKKKELDSFFSSLNEILNIYMKQNEIEMVIEKKSIIMSNKNSNITKIILELMNKK